MSEKKPPITNTQLRRMGWGAFGLAAVMAVASGFDVFNPSDAVILGFLAHAAVSFGLPTYRNVKENSHAARPNQV